MKYSLTCLFIFLVVFVGHAQTNDVKQEYDSLLSKRINIPINALKTSFVPYLGSLESHHHTISSVQGTVDFAGLVAVLTGILLIQQKNSAGNIIFAAPALWASNRIISVPLNISLARRYNQNLMAKYISSKK